MTGCEARSSVEAAQTAVVVAQTVVPVAQLGSQQLATVLQSLLAGASVDLRTMPEGAPNDTVTDVAINATDTQGVLGQVDSRARQAAAMAALSSAAQYYPRATINLQVTDGTGEILLSGSVAPGQTPSIQ